ncbi:MAG: class I SAM-dependent methyltransferase [Flavobacteriales bacterium]|nr:class I SAM-dependent methyltransferase [Flavobacteriales bacterium]
MKKNEGQYNQLKVIEEYGKQSYILEPEKVIFSKVTESGLSEKMVDIGIGTGRTVPYIAKYFSKYIGVDYAEEMINFCKKKFVDLENCMFQDGDARDMKFIESDSIDFSFFSFNGIDCVRYEDRAEVFKEIIRIAKPGSYFAFSSHNFYNLPKLFSYQIPKNPLKWRREYIRYRGVHKHNDYQKLINSIGYVSVIDGDNNNFDFEYVYIKPEFQIENLIEAGFSNIEAFNLKGDKVDVIGDWQQGNDPWIHFLCSVKK